MKTLEESQAYIDGYNSGCNDEEYYNPYIPNSNLYNEYSRGFDDGIITRNGYPYTYSIKL